MTWINHPALRDLRELPTGEAQRIANERMAEWGEFMGQFHVLTMRDGTRYVIEAYCHHRNPIRNPLGIVAQLPKVKTQDDQPLPIRRRRRT